MQPGEHEWRVLRELADNVTTLEVTNNDGSIRLSDIGTEITRTVLTCDAENFEIAAELDAYEAGRRVYSENWHHAIPRDFI